jgi:phasin family protein
MTARKFSQTPPDKANELFNKLLATSDAAAKTRERLFDDLKQELELLANLQEEHLFPVLRRHEMQDLVREATHDNEETRALLAELEGMPKNGGEFLSRVAELKRVFQQHIRDDKKELLPAVLKILSDPEANTVVEKVEDEMASINETNRAEARRAREQGETVQRVTEDVADTMKAGVEGAQTVVRAMQEAVGNSLEAVAELTRRSTGQALQVFGSPDQDAQGLTEEVSHNLRAVAQSSTALTRGLQDVSREVFERSQQRLQRNLDGLQALARCRSITDLVTVQTSLLRDNLEQTVENSRRIAEVTIQTADEVTKAVTVQVESTTQRVNRAA